MKCEDCDFWSKCEDCLDYGECSEPEIVKAEIALAARSDRQNPDLIRHKNDNCISFKEKDAPDEYYVELLENLCDYCGYFNGDVIVNNNYGCDHPDCEETDIVKIDKDGEQEYPDEYIEGKILRALLRAKYGSIRQIREALKTESGLVFYRELRIQVLCDKNLYKRFAHYKLQGKCYSFSCPIASVCNLETLKEYDQSWYEEYENEEYDPSESGADLMLVNKKILTTGE